MPATGIVSRGIARKKRSDAAIARKSGMDTFADLFRRMSSSEQATVLEVLRQIQRLGLPAAQGQEEPSGDNNV